jgi:hypothetical protein
MRYRLWTATIACRVEEPPADAHRKERCRQRAHHECYKHQYESEHACEWHVNVMQMQCAGYAGAMCRVIARARGGEAREAMRAARVEDSRHSSNAFNGDMIHDRYMCAQHSSRVSVRA